MEQALADQFEYGCVECNKSSPMSTHNTYWHVDWHLLIAKIDELERDRYTLWHQQTHQDYYHAKRLVTLIRTRYENEKKKLNIAAFHLEQVGT